MADNFAAIAVVYQDRYQEAKARIAVLEKELAEVKASYAEEIAEFNAGCDAAKEGKSEGDEPLDTKHDVWRVGYAWFKYNGLKAEWDRLREAEKAALEVDADWTPIAPEMVDDADYKAIQRYKLYALRDALAALSATAGEPEKKGGE